MLHEYLPIVVAAGAGKEGVVAVIHVNKLLSGVQGEVCKGQKAQCERGQNKVVYALTQRNGLRGYACRNRETEGEPPKHRGKHRKEHKPYPEGRNRAHYKTYTLDYAVECPLSEQRHDAADDKAQYARE